MTLVHLITLLYFVSFVLFGAYLWTQKEKISRYAFIAVIAAVACHTVLLASILLKGEAVAGGASRSIFVFTWFVVVVFLISQLRFNTPVIGAFISPAAFIGTLQAVIIPSGVIATDPTLDNPWIMFHIILIFFGQAFFAIAFISGLLYILQEDRLKRKKVGKFLKKIPSLTTLDRINHYSLLIGFPFLTIGLATGHILAKEIWAENWVWGAKETWSTVAWLLYAFLINGRISSGWKGRKSAMGAVVGFAIVIFTFLVGYIIPGQHRFG